MSIPITCIKCGDSLDHEHGIISYHFCKSCHDSEVEFLKEILTSREENICPHCEQYWAPPDESFGVIKYCDDCHTDIWEEHQQEHSFLDRLIRPGVIKASWETKFKKKLFTLLHNQYTNRDEEVIEQVESVTESKARPDRWNHIADILERVTPGTDPLELVNEAWTCIRNSEYILALELSSEAIIINPRLVDAYHARALASRCDGDLDTAIDDYTAIIEIESDNSDAFLYRAACKTQKAADLPENERLAFLNEAHSDYKRAAQLGPDNEQTGLALLELEICISKYHDAAETTELWWNRIKSTPYKIICAWLGAIALILADRPEADWAHFSQFLDDDKTNISATTWSVQEIDMCIKSLEDEGYDPGKLELIKSIHDKFQQHFGDNERVKV